jgi:hypothetical protein
MRIIGRLGALILGLIGVVVGLIANFVGTVHGYATDVTHHGFIGILLLLVGLFGSIIAMFTPIFAAILLLIAGLGFFYVLGWGALFVAPFFIVAAVLAYIDRRPTTATAL